MPDYRHSNFKQLFKEIEMDKKKEEEKMVLYRCPYCGRMNLKALEDIRGSDVWDCVYCKTKFEAA